MLEDSAHSPESSCCLWTNPQEPPPPRAWAPVTMYPQVRGPKDWCWGGDLPWILPRTLLGRCGQAVMSFHLGQALCGVSLLSLLWGPPYLAPDSSTGALPPLSELMG